MNPEREAAHDGRDHPDVIAWPPLIFTVTVLVGYVLQRADPIVVRPLLPARPAAVVLALTACAVAGWAGFAMKAAGTAIHPSHPTTAVVRVGPYRFTRNPMYLSLCLLALAAGAWTGGLWVLLATPALGLVLHWGVIRREERYLSAKFGEPYRAYCAKVRRWL